MKTFRWLSWAVLFIGVVAVIIGAVFVGLGVANDIKLREAMQQEQVALGIESEMGDEVIDTMSEAMKAGDTIREHRRSIAPSYSDLLREGRYDPTNPEHLTYAQAMNLENYLYLAVIGFGLTQAIMGSGAFMLLSGVAFAVIGVLLHRAVRLVP